MFWGILEAQPLGNRAGFENYLKPAQQQRTLRRPRPRPGPPPGLPTQTRPLDCLRPPATSRARPASQGLRLPRSHLFLACLHGGQVPAPSTGPAPPRDTSRCPRQASVLLQGQPLSTPVSALRGCGFWFWFFAGRASLSGPARRLMSTPREGPHDPTRVGGDYPHCTNR